MEFFSTGSSCPLEGVADFFGVSPSFSFPGEAVNSLGLITEDEDDLLARDVGVPNESKESLEEFSPPPLGVAPRLRARTAGET